MLNIQPQSIHISSSTMDAVRRMGDFKVDEFDSLKSADDQKEFIGEYLYTGISNVYGPDTAGFFMLILLLLFCLYTELLKIIELLFF
jgi:hypothetical protein